MQAACSPCNTLTVFVLMATFRPTECLMALALCFPRARFYAVERTHATSVPFVTHQGGPGSCFGLNVKVVYWGTTNGGTLSKTSSQRGSAPGAGIARRPAWHYRSADACSRRHRADAGPPGSRRAHNDTT